MDGFNYLLFLPPMLFLFLSGLLWGVLFGLMWRRRRAARGTFPAWVLEKHPDPKRKKRGSVTFALESGERLELPLPASDYALLARGDRGRLIVQGGRYAGFIRDTE